MKLQDIVYAVLNNRSCVVSQKDIIATVKLLVADSVISPKTLKTIYDHVKMQQEYEDAPVD